LLGAGGTGNAIAMTLAQRGAKLMILNRTIAKAEALAKRVNQFIGRSVAQAGGEEAIASQARWAQVIVNVSTKGATGVFAGYSALAPARTPVNAANIAANLQASAKVMASLGKEVVISDINLTAEPTPTLSQAAEHGLIAQNGVAMVVNQGVRAFWLLHGPQLDRQNVSQAKLAQVMSQAAGLNI